MNLRQELIEFLTDWYRENPLVGKDKIELKIDKYLFRKNKTDWEKQVVAELTGCCPHCSETVTFNVPVDNVDFDEHIEVVVTCGNPGCQKDFYVYIQTDAHVSGTPLTVK